MLDRLRRWIRWQRQKAFTRSLVAGRPVEGRITELCIEADERGIDALTARQQLVVRTWSARGVIGNGGFRYFYEGSQPMPPVADGFRALGFEAAARACERSMSVFPGGVPPTDPSRRWKLLAACDFDVLQEEESAVFEVSWDALERALDDYMRRHPRDFPGIG